MTTREECFDLFGEVVEQVLNETYYSQPAAA